MIFNQKDDSGTYRARPFFFFSDFLI